VQSSSEPPEPDRVTQALGRFRSYASIGCEYWLRCDTDGPAGATFYQLQRYHYDVLSKAHGKVCEGLNVPEANLPVPETDKKCYHFSKDTGQWEVNEWAILHKARLRALRDCSYKGIITLFREYGVNATTGEPVTNGETDLTNLHKAYKNMKQELRTQFVDALDGKPDATLELAFRELRRKGDTDTCEKIKRLTLIPELETEAAEGVRKELEVEKQGFLRVWQTLLKQYLKLRRSGLDHEDTIKVICRGNVEPASANAINKRIDDLHRLQLLYVGEEYPELLGGLQEVAFEDYRRFYHKCKAISPRDINRLIDEANYCFTEPIPSNKVMEVLRSIAVVEKTLTKDKKTRLYKIVRSRNLQDFFNDNGIEISDNDYMYWQGFLTRGLQVDTNELDKTLKNSSLRKV
jgi:hypothetical protein